MAPQAGHLRSICLSLVSTLGGAWLGSAASRLTWRRFPRGRVETFANALSLVQLFVRQAQVLLQLRSRMLRQQVCAAQVQRPGLLGVLGLRLVLLAPAASLLAFVALHQLQHLHQLI